MRRGGGGGAPIINIDDFTVEPARVEQRQQGRRDIFDVFVDNMGDRIVRGELDSTM
jgi:hypothetical protein